MGRLSSFENHVRSLSDYGLIKLFHQTKNMEKQMHFHGLGKWNRRNYTDAQKQYAFSLIDYYGIRATARILDIPRRTIQRWCRQAKQAVRRCPAWVFEWVEFRRRRREFWERRGYS